MKEGREIAERLYCLIALSSAAHERPPLSIRDWINSQHLRAALTPREEEFIFEDEQPHSEVEWASWKIEAVPVLMWAVGFIEEVPSASELVTWDALGIDDDFLRSAKKNIDRAKARPGDELAAMQERMAALHWGSRSGPAGRRLFPSDGQEEGANPGVAIERHRSANWLVSTGESWDDIDTDT